MKNSYWRKYPPLQLERIIAHAKYRLNKGKSPSMSFWEEKNPRLALKKAMEWVAEKTEAKEHTRSRLSRDGNLSHSEIEELLRFEFIYGPESIEEQVRRYYLKLKTDHPTVAEQMLSATQPVLNKLKIEVNLPDGTGRYLDPLENRLEKVIEDLCFTLYKYWSGFIIRYKNKTYTVTKGQFRQV